MEFLIYGVLAYILGSIPTAVWIGKSWFDTDIREHGSKNAGATNTFRVLGKKAGIVVLSIDILKGVLATLLPFLWGDFSWYNDHLIHLKLVAGLCAVLGHIFPLFANFNGGKGVATSLGIIIGIHPPAAFICAALFLVVFLISNYVSLGAIIGSISFPFSVEFVFKNENTVLMIFSILLSTTVVILHHKNIMRLLDGTENKMNLFKK
jgi:glycerol-3-phosphate acyltransferase PlsY